MRIEDDGDNNGNGDGDGRVSFSRVGYQNSGCQRRVGVCGVPVSAMLLHLSVAES